MTTELGERRLALETVGERGADVRTEQLVHLGHLSCGAFEEHDLIGSEPVAP